MGHNIETDLVVKVADCIVSPQGNSSAENYIAVKAGKTQLRRYVDHWNIPEPFVASLFDRSSVDCAFAALPKQASLDEYTFFEKIAILSVCGALSKTSVDASSARVRFVLSTTKGNVDLLSSAEPSNRVLLGVTADKIAAYFGNPNKPIVVSNACISGVCAQIEASRYLLSGTCDYVIVVGADCQSKFIISGFQSFKALSPELCRPFDANRVGLNLGEAAGTIIYTCASREDVGNQQWVMRTGAIRNDANHISGPSRTGEGSYRALRKVLGERSADEIAFINAHGTATLYNDEMESIAIQRAGLLSVPVNSLKGYYGHTMGAAGVIETILSMQAVDDHTILATKGYEACGVSQPVSVSNEIRQTDKTAFIKLLSGFGGCNAAILFEKGVMH